MTDARLPDVWLGLPKFEALSDAAWRVWTAGLMWSNRYATDGAIPKHALRVLHPEGDKPDAVRELVDAGLWSKDGEGWKVVGWAGKDAARGGCRQSLAGQVAEYNRKNRERQARWRARETDAVTEEVTRYEPRDVTEYVSEYVGSGSGSGSGTGASTESTPYQLGGDAKRNASVVSCCPSCGAVLSQHEVVFGSHRCPASGGAR